LVVLGLVLRWKLAVKYRTLAEKKFSKRFLQALVFSPLIILTIDVLELPTSIYDNWVSRQYDLSVQRWGSWFWDWTERELITVIIGTILIGRNQKETSQAGCQGSQDRWGYRMATFRHTCRSWLDETGVPMKVQQELMRHVSIQTTMNVYGQAMSDSKRDANSKVVRLALGAERAATV
jgi:hypothetical protein